MSAATTNSAAKNGDKNNSNKNNNFKSIELSMSIQKKVFGRMASNKNVMKHLIDETAGNLLDNLHRLTKCYMAEVRQQQQQSTGGAAIKWRSSSKKQQQSQHPQQQPPKDGEKVVKNMIKIVIKLAVLAVNDKFSTPNQIAAIEKLQRQIRSTLMTIVSFHEVDFSYDRTFLRDSLQSIGAQLKSLVEPHLTDKSVRRIDLIADFFANCDFLDRLYASQRSSLDSLNDPIYKIRCEMIADVKALLERGKF